MCLFFEITNFPDRTIGQKKFLILERREGENAYVCERVNILGKGKKEGKFV